MSTGVASFKSSATFSRLPSEQAFQSGETMMCVHAFGRMGASEGARGAEGRRKGGWQKAERETGRGWSCTRILNENRDTASSHICSALTRKKLD